MVSIDEIRRPIGAFHFDPDVTDEHRRRWVDEIAAAPAALGAAVSGLSPEQLDTSYRPGGWTVRQVAHHLTDSHMNAYVRIKLALTEDSPTVKPYDENRWAELVDGRSAPVELSVALLDALHQRWVLLLRTFTPADFTRTYFHPEQKRTVPLDEVIGLYAWHGRHHVAQITSLRHRMQWR